MHYTAVRGLFSGFPGVYTGGMRFWKFKDMVWKMHKEGVNDGVSQCRDDVLNIEAMDFRKNAPQYPVIIEIIAGELAVS